MTINLSQVCFSYRAKEVISDLSWRIPTGITGLLGPNGAGKTTLLHLIAGLLKPKSGRITGLSGQKIGFVPQKFSFAGEMSLVDAVAYTAWINGLSTKTCQAAALTAIDAVNLGEKAKDKVRSLSGGQRQRLGIAAAIAHDPEILILDEPTVGLDPTQRLRVREIIAELGTTRTVILSTHLLEDVAHTASTVSILGGGRLLFNDTISELDALVAGIPQEKTLGTPFESAYAALVQQLGVES